MSFPQRVGVLFVSTAACWVHFFFLWKRLKVQERGTNQRQSNSRSLVEWNRVLPVASVLQLLVGLWVVMAVVASSNHIYGEETIPPTSSSATHNNNNSGSNDTILEQQQEQQQQQQQKQSIEQESVWRGIFYAHALFLTCIVATTSRDVIFPLENPGPASTIRTKSYSDTRQNLKREPSIWIHILVWCMDVLVVLFWIILQKETWFPSNHHSQSSSDASSFSTTSRLGWILGWTIVTLIAIALLGQTMTGLARWIRPWLIIFVGQERTDKQESHMEQANPYERNSDRVNDEHPIVHRSHGLSDWQHWSATCCPLPMWQTKRSSDPSFVDRGDSFHHNTREGPPMALDESQWLDWNITESMSWLERALTERSLSEHSLQREREDSENCNTLAATDNIMTCLRHESLTCQQLAYQLSIQDVRLATGLPYGWVLRVNDIIQEKLVSNYPSPHHEQNHPSRRQGMANQEKIPDAETQTTRFVENSNDHLVRLEAQDSKVSREVEMVQQLMQEKFGLQLPEPMTENPSSANNAVAGRSVFSPNDKYSSADPLAQQLSSPSLEDANSWPDSLPPEFLLAQQMPEHIQDIVQRRPQLAVQILEQQRNRRPPPLSFPDKPRSSAGEAEMELAEIQEEEQNYQDEYEESSDGETTQLLLRNRRKKPSGGTQEMAKQPANEATGKSDHQKDHGLLSFYKSTIYSE